MIFLETAKRGRKAHDRTQSAAMLAESEIWSAACYRAKKENRPIEFEVPATRDHGKRTLLALPCGTVTSKGGES